MTTDPSKYDYFQQIYALSTASNVVGSQTGTSKALGQGMYNALKKHLPNLAGSWDLKWGPAVYKQNPNDTCSGPDNVWFVAVSDTARTCTVAIAGTAVYSANDWIDDLDVTQVVDFTSWASPELWKPSKIPAPTPTQQNGPSDPRILCALGTSSLVWNVLQPIELWNNTTPPPLAQFLQEFHALRPDYTIVFTGHSLGGALVPELAMGLVASKILDNSKNQIKVLASAGPTPGNEAFASAFATTFPMHTVAPDLFPYNTNRYNNLDIVPQAFSVQTSDNRNLYNITENIYTMYVEIDGWYWRGNTQYKVWLEAFALRKAAIDLANEGLDPSAGYRPIQGLPFTGPAIPIEIMDDCQLFDQVDAQHTTNYWIYLDILNWVQDFTTTVQAEPDIEPRKPKPAVGLKPSPEDIAEVEKVLAEAKTLFATSARAKASAKAENGGVHQAGKVY